jgi:hypothetical protein
VTGSVVPITPWHLGDLDGRARTLTCSQVRPTGVHTACSQYEAPAE